MSADYSKAMITRGEVETLADDEIASVLFNRIIRIPEYTSSEVQLLDLPAHVRLIYSLSELEGEIYNGGFNQFFWNNGDSLNAITLESLATIGASEHVALFREAVATWDVEGQNPEVEKLRSRSTAKSFTDSYSHTTLYELDKRFCALQEIFDRLRAAWIRSHWEEWG